MNRKNTLLGLSVSLMAGMAFSSCGGMWLDSGGMGGSVYDDYGPYWMPGTPPPPAYSPVFGPSFGWDSPVYYPGNPGPPLPPPTVNRPKPPLRPAPGNGPSGPGVNRPVKPSVPDQGPGALPSNPNLNRPARPSQSSNSGDRPQQAVRPSGGASSRH